MAVQRRYTVVTDPDVEVFLVNQMVNDPPVMGDIRAMDSDLGFAPRSAGELKASGYYVGRRGAIEFKFHVSDDDRKVRIIGARRCVHLFDVALSRAAKDCLLSTKGTAVGGACVAGLQTTDSPPAPRSTFAGTSRARGLVSRGRGPCDCDL